MPGTSGLPLAGVEAIVEGLASFQGDIKSMNSALDTLRPRQTLLQNAFEGAWEMVKNFGREVLNVAEYALGHLLADAIQGAIQKIGELIQATIDAGSEFQTLELRLRHLNFNALVESGTDAASAQSAATQMTKEQLEWLQKLAATTPYDNADISRVYTLTRSYGFADAAARQLTQDTLDFAAGMGLGSTEIERVIVNFGQMVQQGKVTQRELNDLARGSFVPINDILLRMSRNTGIAVDALDEFRRTPESVPAFFTAFHELMSERFAGSAQEMARTFKAASDNAQDVVKSIGGLNVVKPILDVLGEKVASFVSAFTDDPARWNRLVEAAKRVGNALAMIVTDLFKLAPSSQALADAVIALIEKLATWIETHRGDIELFFKGIVDWVRESLIPAFQRLAAWFQENWPLIKEFFGALSDIIITVFMNLTQGLREAGKERDFLDLITAVMRFVVDNKDKIAEWVELLLKAFIAWQVLATIWNIVIGIVIKLVGFILGLVAVFSTFTAVIQFLGPVLAGIATFITATLIPAIAAIAAPVLAVIAVLVVLALQVYLVYLAFKNNWFGIRDIWTTGLANFRTMLAGFGAWLGGFMGQIVNTLHSAFSYAVQSIRDRWGEWVDAGRNLIYGLITGIRSAVSGLVSSAVSAVTSAYNAAKSFLRIRSPSQLFENIGALTMEGFAQGIEGAVGLVAGTMQNAMSAVTMPAFSSMAVARAGGDTITNNRTANLTINSSAPTEPIVADFQMLLSMIGA